MPLTGASYTHYCDTQYAASSHCFNASAKLYQMDDTVDALYRKYLREVITQENDKDKRETDPRCFISGLLILRYLERISDHACYIGDSIHYSVTGRSGPRR